MTRIQVSKNFNLDELVDPYTYYTESDRGLSLIDPKIVDCLQLLRSLKGSSIGVNNWWGHSELSDSIVNTDQILKFQEWIDDQKHVHQWSGYRSDFCKIGARKSKHKLGQAVDPKGDESELFGLVMDNAKLFYDFGLRRLEDISITVGWLHMDTSEDRHQKGNIRIINTSSHVGNIKV